MHGKFWCNLSNVFHKIIEIIKINFFKLCKDNLVVGHGNSSYLDFLRYGKLKR